MMGVIVVLARFFGIFRVMGIIAGHWLAQMRGVLCAIEVNDHHFLLIYTGVRPGGQF